MKIRYTTSLFLIGCLFLFAASPAFAQKRQIKKADSAYVYHSYYDALKIYQKNYGKLRKGEEKDRVAFRIAECYRQAGFAKQAVSQYKRLARAKYYMIEPKIYLYIAQMQLVNGDFADAYENFKTYLDFIPNDTMAQLSLISALKVEDAMSNISRYEISNVAKLNTKDSDYTPRYYTIEGDIITFTSTREGVTGKKLDSWTGQRFSDIWVSKVDEKGEWSTPEKLDQNEKTSTDLNESDASFCHDGTVMYYTYCNNDKKKSNRCVIKTSSFDGTAWSEPVEVNIAGDTISDFIHPHISEDGSKLYFASNKEGGYGDLDIWFAVGSGSEFTEAINAGPFVNTPKKENYPFLRNDTSLYFSSTGHNNLGGYDIFKATLTDESEHFMNVENLSYPINTNSDDFGICFIQGENRGMFSSNRAGGKGSDDIYYFNLPDVIYTLSGFIKNSDNMQPLSDVEVEIISSSGKIYRTLSNSKGFYRFDNSQIRPEESYDIFVDKHGFLNQQSSASTEGLVLSADLVVDFSLEKIPQGPVVLPEILYDLGAWELKPMYEDSLIDLVMLMEKNPRLVVELASHTDVRPILMGNDSLSQLRAVSVVEYLIRRGINSERLVAKGYGSRVPRELSTNMSISIGGFEYTFDSGIVLTPEYIESLPTAERKEAAHSLNRRTEFSVLRDDFIPSTNGEENTEVKVGIGSTEEDAEIIFAINPNGMVEFTSIVNGTGMQTLYSEKSRHCVIHTDAAYNLLLAGKLSKKDFADQEKAFDEDGEVLPGKKLVIKEIKIGKYYIKNLELTTTTDLSAEILLNKSALHSLGNIVLDRESSLLKFEK